jgi:hypothetical protein
VKVSSCAFHPLLEETRQEAIPKLTGPADGRGRPWTMAMMMQLAWEYRVHHGEIDFSPIDRLPLCRQILAFRSEECGCWLE